MIVIELEEKQYGKYMESVSMIKQAIHCLEEMIEDNSIGKSSIGYRTGNMSQRGGMGYREPEYEKEYPEYERMQHRGYREDYGKRFM